MQLGTREGGEDLEEDDEDREQAQGPQRQQPGRMRSNTPQQATAAGPARGAARGSSCMLGILGIGMGGRRRFSPSLPCDNAHGVDVPDQIVVFSVFITAIACRVAARLGCRECARSSSSLERRDFAVGDIGSALEHVNLSLKRDVRHSRNVFDEIRSLILPETPSTEKGSLAYHYLQEYEQIYHSLQGTK